MTRRRLAMLLLLLLVTVPVYVGALLLTAFWACGISGCSGGGFGVSYDPVGTQVWLLACGAVLAPVALVLTAGHRWPVALVGSLVLSVAGTVLAMGLLQLGPDGCPLGEDRAVVGGQAFEAGEATCSGDRQAAGS